MNPSDMKVMNALNLSGGLDAAAVAIAAGVGYSTATASLRRLHTAGEIVKTKNGYAANKASTRDKPTGIAASALTILRRSKAAMTAYAIAAKLGKSAGAVSNACERLREDGHAKVAGRKPRTYMAVT